jgi:hypothetical protein
MNTENKVLSLVYTFFLGLLLAIFIGTGIATFYSAPTEPEYPDELEYFEREPTAEQMEAQRDFDKQRDDFYENSERPYNRNVSMIALGAAVALLAASIFLDNKKMAIISDGVMLGGFFTVLYSLMRGFAAQDSSYVFIVVTIGLGIALYLGYHRFVPKTEAKKK